jgi:hypothetical protein
LLILLMIPADIKYCIFVRSRIHIWRSREWFTVARLLPKHTSGKRRGEIDRQEVPDPCAHLLFWKKPFVNGYYRRSCAVFEGQEAFFDEFGGRHCCWCRWLKILAVGRSGKNLKKVNPRILWKSDEFLDRRSRAAPFWTSKCRTR